MTDLDYEFNSQENELVGGLAATVTGAARPIAIFGVLQLLFGGWLMGKFGWSGSVLVVLACLVGVCALGLAYFLKQAGSSLQRIVDTQGADIGHLMAAFGSLKRFFYGGVMTVCLLCLGLFGGIVDRISAF